jgi:hypothetical protein
MIKIHTELVAAQIRATFPDDPEGQLQAWAAIAQQREAMVVNLYSAPAIARRLPVHEGPSTSLLEVVGKTVGGIWAQERSHVTLIDSFRSVDGVRARGIRTVMGSVEGLMTQVATSSGMGGPVSRWLIGLARAAGAAPEFTKYLSELDLRGFFRFSMELEETAHLGYARVLDLLDELDHLDAAMPSLKYGASQRYEFTKIDAEERFHCAVFQHLCAWLSEDGTEFLQREPREAALELRALADRILSVRLLPGTFAALGAESHRGELESVQDQLVSDGGLAAVFAEFSLDAHVAEPIGDRPT